MVSFDLRNPGRLPAEAQQLLISLHAFESLAGKFGFQIQTHASSSFVKFLALDLMGRRSVLEGFQKYLVFLMDCERSGLDLRDTRGMLKKFLNDGQYIYDKTLLDRIQSDDVVEIYTPEQTQIFRNLKFMDLCNYTLLDLLVYTPYELYERSQSVIEDLLTTVETMRSRSYNTMAVEMAQLPTHLLREKFSEQRLTSKVEFKFAAPLYDWPPRKMVAFMVVQKGENLIALSPSQELSFL